MSGFWNENYGHIYPTLKVLLANEMINIVERGKNDNKIKYQITEKGREELTRWLLNETEQQPVRSEFILKFIFSSNQSYAQIEKMMLDYKSIYVKKIEKYQETINKMQEGDANISTERSRFLYAILRRGILSSQAVIDWCNETLQELKTKTTDENTSC